MAEKLCEICHQRPATLMVRISQNGREQTMNLCEPDYQRLQAASNRRSPFESLFGSDNLFGRFFDDRTDGNGDDNEIFGDFGRRSGLSSRRERDSINVLDYFSDQAKELLQKAANETAQRGKREVDTEDLLYELADNEVVLTILKQFKISTQDLKGYIEANAAQRSKDSKSKAGEIGISPRVKSALQLALRVAQDMGHSYVGPEHLLVGLSEEEDGLAGQILRKFGLTPQALRQQTVKVVGKGAEEGRVSEPSETPQLDKFSRDLTALAKKGKLDPVIGRSEEIETMIEVLARRKKNNPVLIGEPGVGKTAIVEGLAQRINNGDVPEVLRDKRLVELNVNSMVAGSKYRGEFEERIKNVLEEIVQHSDRLVIFIDELHTIVGIAPDRCHHIE
jgi:ATP-dependent Clp protease ATP-binding subunit ClpC